MTALGNYSPWHIQRSMDGVHFVNIGQIEECGITQFNFTDKTLPAAVQQVYHRLAQMNGEGILEYSEILRVLFENIYTHRIHIYPNPSQGNIYVVNRSSNEIKSLRIYDASGKLLQRYDGLMPLALDWNSFPAGVYMISISFGDQQQENHRVVRW